LAKGLKKYVEWMSRGRRTDRVAYVMSERHLPEPKIGAAWQIDSTFNAAEELLCDPDLMAVFKSAIDSGAAVLVRKTS
jgi:hypothetical protein